MHSVRQPLVTQRKNFASDSIGAKDKLVIVDSEKQSGAVIVRRGSRNGPRVAKMLAKHAFLDRSGGDYRCLENQWERSIVAFPIHSGNIQDSSQLAVRVKNGRAGTA
jgi:hypothetical protein